MDSPVNFQISDFLELGDWKQYPQLGVSNYHQNQAYVAIEVSYGIGSGSSSSHNIEPAISENRGVKERVAFKTRTQIEVLDDGFKWRKYGKKKVKNSPNPRNYYKCSFEGCPVKKRVERDSEDYGILITTYDGVHNHESPTGL